MTFPMDHDLYASLPPSVEPSQCALYASAFNSVSNSAGVDSCTLHNQPGPVSEPPGSWDDEGKREGGGRGEKGGEGGLTFALGVLVQQPRLVPQLRVDTHHLARHRRINVRGRLDRLDRSDRICRSSAPASRPHP